MTYNLGPGGMRGFVKFIAAMKRGDWTAAQAEGSDSAWCGEVGGRCDRNMWQI